jgi:hypothetical protein
MNEILFSLSCYVRLNNKALQWHLLNISRSSTKMLVPGNVRRSTHSNSLPVLSAVSNRHD